ncbi:MAG TPA: TolC family protein [Bacteroidota bacterium]|nr:TolC family protein [Bacteroidota bacterium]
MNARSLIATLVVGLTPALFAQERVLTIEESIAIGLENSRALHSSEMSREYADAKAQEASAGLYPSLKAQAGYQRLSDIPPQKISIPLPGNPSVSFPIILNNYTAKATLQQPLFTGWKIQSAVDAAHDNAEASKEDYAKEKAELIYNIKSAYWGLYRAEEFKRVSDENVSQISSHLADIQSMFDQGMATTNDVLKIKVQLSGAKLMQSEAANDVQIATIGFNSTIGIPLSTTIRIGSKLTSTTKEFPAVDQLLASAFSERHDMQGMEWRLKAAESGVTGAKSGWSPQLFLTGDYLYARPNQRYFPALDAFKDSWDVGISLQFDLWNNLTTVYQTTEARAQYEQTKDQIAILKDGVTLEVTQSYLSFKQAKENIQLSRLGVDQATENLRLTHEKFKAGLTTNSEMLDAEVALLQAKLQLTQTLVDYELAQAKLEKAIGADEK